MNCEQVSARGDFDADGRDSSGRPSDRNGKRAFIGSIYFTRQFYVVYFQDRRNDVWKTVASQRGLDTGGK